MSPTSYQTALPRVLSLPRNNNIDAGVLSIP
jgi:hypothetical protein